MRVIEFFDRGAQINPDGVAFMAPDGSHAITYAQTAETTHRVAAALQRDGMTPETPVGILGPNLPETFPCVLGILRSGCAWVMLNARSMPSDLAALMELVGARALLYSTRMADAVAEIQAGVPTLERLVALDGGSGGEHPTLEEWMEPTGTHVPLQPLDPEATAAFSATGGTTGRSKAVTTSHRSLETMIHAFNAHMPERDPVHLVAAPITHAAGAAIFPVLSLGGTNVVHDGVSAPAVLESIERNRVTRLFLPPTAIYSLLDHPDARTRDMSSLRYFLYGAAPMSVEKLRESLDVFGPVMAQCYGQAELPMLVTYLSPEEHSEALADPALEGRLASCGRPSLVAHVAIMDDDGVIQPTGSRGEICARSSLHMSGYFNDPEQTAAIQREGGWQATGDVGYMDEHGYVYIVDRKRDMIISGGFNVFPSEVEQVIWGHPSVNDCAVIGVPDEKWGEQVTAVVELKAGAEAEADEIIALCKERLGSVKAPKDVIFRELPRSPVGKVLKRALRDEFWSGRERQV
ncbi:MAG TPA: AMP-binding protein [Conexibacter sp.]|nr:AMP-binding protein [Conexibacter sp.]